MKVEVIKGFGKQEIGSIIDMPDLLVPQNVKLGRVKIVEKKKVKATRPVEGIKTK